MGIYYSERIYGVSIRHTEENYTRFEQVFPNAMTRDDMLGVYDIYSSLDLSGMDFYIYTECSTSYEKDAKTDMIWVPITQERLKMLLKPA